MKLRSIEMVMPKAAEAADFMLNIWKIAPAGVKNNTHYLRGSGSFPYLVAFEEGEKSYVRSVTFVCEQHELDALKQRVAASGLATKSVESMDLGGGKGIIVELKEGELLRFLVGSEEVAPIEDKDLPTKLTHVVFNAADAEASGHLVEDVLGFTVSDRTKGMVFVRCNDSHHSTAFARAGFSSLNHIAFEMQDVDAVMRGIGRLRDHQFTPAWGPGRHGPGDNVYAYFIAPYGAVVEFSTAVNKVPADYKVGEPDDWTWPANRIDQWGVSDKDFDGLKIAEANFKFYRDWKAETLS
ncbi:MAG: VOC family protein [Paraglaciecola sp.]|jgi:2,3-dihydroxy-p-cumate/2,3-dihydroxybenzoate 3,4-dioxygenase|uniref:VOC family protein n=1 Tax=Paraglaciecola sp. TaxID=1920173 RepID=UPI00273DB642|nr:VOC family protein [Paraglaciecola sp.]MDP5031637.1 VOC family protein [Paraglaciecola sp.]MDP5133332.1 VOC family protein [Paraglaciecola sp.]